MSKITLGNCKLLGKLDDSDLKVLVENGKVKQFDHGEIIYKKGDSSIGIFCMIISGRVEILAGTGKVIKEMGPNEIIGDIGVISPQQKRTMTVKTVEPTKVFEWDIKTIQNRLSNINIMEKLKDQAWKNVTEYYEL